MRNGSRTALACKARMYLAVPHFRGATSQFEHGEQLFEPRYSQNGKMVLYSMSIGRGRSIYLRNLASGEVTPLVHDTHDARDAVFSSNGRKIYFITEATIFKISVFVVVFIGSRKTPISI